MKIISDFRDYYDGYSHYNSEDYKVKHWVRKEEDIQISKYTLESLENDLLRTPDNFEAAYIIIAGKVHPYISYHKTGYIDFDFSGKWVDGYTNYYFDAETFMEMYKDYKKDYKPKQHYGWWTNTLSERDVKNFFNTKYSDRIDLCLEFDTPIISIRPKTSGYKERERTYRVCTKNVNLKEHGVSKLFNSPEVYQLLDVFIGNVLVKDEMPMSPMTDLIKIQSHGFDVKTSFRKPKGKKGKK